MIYRQIEWTFFVYINNDQSIRDVTFINCANPLDNLLKSTVNFVIFAFFLSIFYRLNKFSKIEYSRNNSICCFCCCCYSNIIIDTCPAWGTIFIMCYWQWSMMVSVARIEQHFSFFDLFSCFLGHNVFFSSILPIWSSIFAIRSVTTCTTNITNTAFGICRRLVEGNVIYKIVLTCFSKR